MGIIKKCTLATTIVFLFLISQAKGETEKITSTREIGGKKYVIKIYENDVVEINGKKYNPRKDENILVSMLMSKNRDKEIEAAQVLLRFPDSQPRSKEVISAMIDLYKRLPAILPLYKYGGDKDEDAVADAKRSLFVMITGSDDPWGATILGEALKSDNETMRKMGAFMKEALLNKERQIAAMEMYRESVVIDNRRMKVEEAVSLWIKELQNPEPQKRLAAVSNLFQAAAANPTQMSYNKKISKAIVTAYKKESEREIKLVLLAILDINNDPEFNNAEFNNLLEKVSENPVPKVHNLVNLIQNNKEYLKSIRTKDDINLLPQEKRRQFFKALNEIGTEKESQNAWLIIEEVFKSDDAVHQIRGIYVMWSIADIPECKAKIITFLARVALENKHRRVRVKAISAIENYPEMDIVVEAITKMLTDDESALNREYALDVIARKRIVKALPDLKRIVLQEKNDALKREMTRAIEILERNEMF